MSKNYIAEGAVVKGNVQMGEDVSIWYNATVRGDSAEIKIGDRTNVQDNAVIHVDTHYPTTIGNGVTIGHGAIVHGCTVGDNTLIGMGAILLNGAVIGKNCIIGAGALVTKNTVIPDYSLVMGSPGVRKRDVTAEEIEANKRNAKLYVEEAKELFGKKKDNEKR